MRLCWSVLVMEEDESPPSFRLLLDLDNTAGCGIARLHAYLDGPSGWDITLTTSVPDPGAVTLSISTLTMKAPRTVYLTITDDGQDFRRNKTRLGAKKKDRTYGQEGAAYSPRFPQSANGVANRPEAHVALVAGPAR